MGKLENQEVLVVVCLVEISFLFKKVTRTDQGRRSEMQRVGSVHGLQVEKKGK
jgi:hypothetical protein